MLRTEPVVAEHLPLRSVQAEGDVVYVMETLDRRLAPLLQQLVDAPALVAAYRQKASARATAYYTWEKVTDDYEAMFKRLRPVMAASMAGRSK